MLSEGTLRPRWLGLTRRQKILNLVLLAALGGGIAAAVLEIGKPSAAPQAAPRTVPVQRGVVQSTVSASGNVAAPATVNVSFASGGLLTAVDVHVGQTVKAGQVLGRVDPSAARISLATAESGLAQAKAQLATDQLGPTDQSLASAKGSVTSAQASLAAARTSLAQTKAANREQVAAAQQSVDQARAQLAADSKAAPSPQSLQSAQASVASAEAQLRLDSQPGGASPQSLQSAQASVTKAQASYLQAQSALADAQTVNDQSIVSAQQTVKSAQTQLGIDQSKLAYDQHLLLLDCGTLHPIIASKTSSQCRGTNSSVTSDQQTLQKDQEAIDSAQLGLAQAQSKASQSLQSSKASRDTAYGALVFARQALKALQSANVQTVAKDRQTLAQAKASLKALLDSNAQTVSQTVAKDRQTLATAQNALAQARTKASQSLSQAEATVRSASVGLANARAQLTALNAGPTAPQLATDRAKIQSAQAQLDSAATALAQTVLRAPSAGTVTAVAGAPGEYVAGGGTAFVTLTNLGHLQVQVGFPEADAAKIAVGQPAVVTLDAVPGRQLAAHVVEIDPTSTVVSNVVTYTVTLALDRTESGVRPGMTASVDVVTAQRSGVLNVPTAAVSSRGGQSTVTVLQNGQERPVPVVTGVQGDTTTEIVSGLKAGQQVVLPSASFSAGGTSSGGGGGGPRGFRGVFFGG